jgi:hypothetical protein
MPCPEPAGRARREQGRPVAGPLAVAQAAWEWKHSLGTTIITGNEAVAVDRQKVARTVSDLRAALPEADDLLPGCSGSPRPPGRSWRSTGLG